MKNFINHIFQIQFQQFLRLSFMVTCQSSELDWEVTVELPADFLSLGRGSVNGLGSSARASLTDGKHKLSLYHPASKHTLTLV